MTCGICAPELFPAAQTGVCFGYVVASDPSKLVREAHALYFMGAKHVFADNPTGNVRHRVGLNRLRKVMREGDALILYSAKALGRKPARAAANMADIEADGITVGAINASAVDAMIWELNVASRRAQPKCTS